MQHTSDRWADVITLGNARFGQLHGGPFDGRCFPLGAGTPEVLHVPVEGLRHRQTASSVVGPERCDTNSGTAGTDSRASARRSRRPPDPLEVLPQVVRLSRRPGGVRARC